MRKTVKLFALLLALLMMLSSCGDAYKDGSATPSPKDSSASSGAEQSQTAPQSGGDASPQEGSGGEGSPESGKEASAENGGEEGSGNAGESGEPAEEQAPDDGKRTGGFTDAPEGYFENALFIGDSRCEGLRKYGGLEGPAWFTDVGLSVFNIKDKELPLEEDGDPFTIDDVLAQRQYSSVYIGLGINELGYDMSIISAKFGELLDKVRAAQPDAVIFLMANIHVTAERSQNDSIYNNERIEELNTAISMFADYDMVYYIDVNPLFDDDSGALDSGKSFDDVHIFARHYPEWAQFLREHAVTLKEGAV